MHNPRISASVALLSSVMASKDARIVELGCGDGSLLMEMADALNIRDVYGVDIDETALKKATCSTMYNVGKFRRNLNIPLSGHLRLYTYRALKQLLELHGFKVITSKGVTYNNLPSVFKHLDNLISKMPSLAQIVMVLAQK